MGIKVGPTGNLIQGHLYDVSRKPLLEALQAYDKFLYLKWNPNKRAGLGCWELRRKPEFKVFVEHGEFNGQKFGTMEYVEQDLVHHILDVPFLSYELVTKIKSIDTWEVKNWVDKLESEERDHRMATRQRAKDELTYNLKQDRRTFRQFKEMVASGLNPGLLGKHWK